MVRRSEAMIQELEVPEPGSEPVHFPTEYAVGRLGQLKTIVWKFACVYWRYSGAQSVTGLPVALALVPIQTPTTLPARPSS